MYVYMYYFCTYVRTDVCLYVGSKHGANRFQWADFLLQYIEMLNPFLLKWFLNFQTTPRHFWPRTSCQNNISTQQMQRVTLGWYQFNLDFKLKSTLNIVHWSISFYGSQTTYSSLHFKEKRTKVYAACRGQIVADYNSTLDASLSILYKSSLRPNGGRMTRWKLSQMKNERAGGEK